MNISEILILVCDRQEKPVQQTINETRVLTSIIIRLKHLNIMQRITPQKIKLSKSSNILGEPNEENNAIN